MRSRQFWVSWLLVGCPAPTPRAPAAARQGPTDISLCSLAGAVVVGAVLGAGCLGLCALPRGGARWDGWQWQCPCQHRLCCREIGAGWQAGGGEGSVCRFTLGREEQARATAVEEALHLRRGKGECKNDTQQGSRQSLLEGVCAVIMNQGRLQEVSQAAESPKLVNAPAARSYMCVRVKAAPAGWPGWGRVGRQQKQLNFPSDCDNQNFSSQTSNCCKITLRWGIAMGATGSCMTRWQAMKRQPVQRHAAPRNRALPASGTPLSRACVACSAGPSRTFTAEQGACHAPLLLQRLSALQNSVGKTKGL